MQPIGGYHAVPLPITGTLSSSKPPEDLSHTTRPLAPIIENWVSDSEDESETNDQNDPQSVPSFVQSSKQVKTPRHSVKPVKAPILAATLKPTSSKSTISSKRRKRKTCFVCRSVDHLIKDLLTQSTPVSITAARPVCAAVPKIMEMMFTMNLFHHLLNPLHHHNYLKIFHPHPKYNTIHHNYNLQPPAQPQAADFPMSLLQEALDACAALTRRVGHLEHDKVA
uniref:Uncharacterized protein n=1 Tax=Tanacetum cinerariifolium TaxID=118510 RepID=A0A6L2JX64_TANCI|nr:hypothetical protein [Tanacetum cinerariifolium]